MSIHGGPRWHIASGKILDWTPGDQVAAAADISGSVPTNCIKVCIQAIRQGATTGVLRVYPNSGAHYVVLGTGGQVANRSALGGEVPIVDQELKLQNTEDDGDWDIEIYGYWTQGGDVMLI